MNCRHCGVLWEFEGWEYCPDCKRNHGGAVYPAKQTDEELREINRLIEQIHTAFAGVLLGEGETIHQADLEGIGGRGSQRWIMAGEKDLESDWSEVPDWKLERMASTLSFFDVEGWRFYLPAFMRWSLRNWRTTDFVTPESLINSLTYNEIFNETFNKFMSSKYESLDHAQSETVYNFLEFFDRFSPDDDAGKAIRSYWHQFKRNDDPTEKSS